MQYWSCKCGKLEAFGSDAPAECMSCDSCKTNCYKDKPAEHHFVKRYDGITGKPYEICMRCMERREFREE